MLLLRLSSDEDERRRLKKLVEEVESFAEEGACSGEWARREKKLRPWVGGSGGGGGGEERKSGISLLRGGVEWDMGSEDASFMVEQRLRQAGQRIPPAPPIRNGSTVHQLLRWEQAWVLLQVSTAAPCRAWTPEAMSLYLT